MSEDLPTWPDLITLAERCERGADALAYEADQAAEVPATRAGGGRVTPDEWAAQKRQAIAAARGYAAELRRDAAELGPAADPDPTRYAQAEMVATAAECGGILIDDRPAAARSAAEYHWHDDAARQAIIDGAAARATAIEASGRFVHIADTIAGVEQLPFWRLTTGGKP